MIDLRSDTVTKPTPAMRRAMAEAEVDDDVIDVDPTVDQLQRDLAERLGKEAAIFMPSGTMTNQVAVRVHCQPGDELICDTDCHIFNYEQGAFAQLSGIVARTVNGDQGMPRLDELSSMVRPDNEHLTRTRLVCLENTHNRAGGRVLPFDEVASICEWARDNGIKTHLDGARLFNAVVSSGIEADQWCAMFDTVSVCFSKGLGAPVGSALAGCEEDIKLARRHRKLFGGGMRQAGVIAAGALHALHHHVDRLSDDHANARLLSDYVRDADGLRLSHPSIDSNIVFFDVDDALGSAIDVMERLQEAGVMVLCESPRRVRLLTHLDVSKDDARRAGEIIQSVARTLHGEGAVGSV